MKILCVHGWACRPAVWGPMNRRLAELLSDRQPELVCADLGFYSDPVLPEGHFDLAIGHSLGLLWLLDNRLVSFDRLISINGFTRFSAATDFQCGWPQRVLQRMQKQLARDSRMAISDFFEKSAATRFVGDEISVEHPDTERLNWGLEALINGDGREQWGSFTGPRRVIAASADAVVPVELTNHCFSNCDIQWLKSDCHLTPLLFPEICAALVRELIEVS